MEKINTETIPVFVSHVTKRLQDAGFEAWLVGGCVRDMLMNRTPKDWDIATNAKPEEVQSVFKDNRTVAENLFGTVTVLNMPVATESRDGEAPDLNNQVQITTYRSDGSYSDNRRPDQVSYETKLEKDLERRDFTINAIAYDPIKDNIKDIFEGIKDIKDKTIRTVRDPRDRFSEDALRLLRAVRFSSELGFAISHETLEAISQNSELLSHISKERIRDEFIKVVNSTMPAQGISLMQKTGLLTHVIPELLEGVGCEQKGEHVYDVFDHLLHAVQHSADKEFATHVRLAALFHDIGKPATRRYDRTKDKYTFFGHEVVGARMTKAILDRLHFSRETVTRVTSLVRNHMFFSDTEKITLSAVRRIIRNVGPENIWDLMQVRECDRVGMKKKEAPYRLRKYHAMIEEALRDPITVGMLKIDGERLKEMGETPGPKFGFVLHSLLEEVLDDPKLNAEEYLEKRAKELLALPVEELKKLGEAGREKREEVEGKEIEKLRGKHGVK